MAFKVPEKYRQTAGIHASDASYGNNGAFAFRLNDISVAFVIASDGGGWEHVSVSVIVGGKSPRTASWDEMCRVKDIFWEPEDRVVQFHPPKSEYVNNHTNVLHLWRQVGADFPHPNSLMVGIAGLELE
jgi:hypothetical protein